MAEPKSASSGRSRPTTARGAVPAPPAVVYVFAEDRKAIRARQLFGDYDGILQVDGYAAYKGLIKNGGRLMQLAFCFAHARRKFWDVHVATKSPIAAEALQRIAMFYAIEDRIRGLPATQRATVRQSDTKAVSAGIESEGFPSDQR
ncbi:IS66 family transposase [Bradyrhizobium sp. I1.14.4]|uniref:IS66 family transposase n=1 Tax=unclassified Bradyrhizobium TaxID=2631580 RepID=UPI003D191374